MYGLRRQGGWAGGTVIRIPYRWGADGADDSMVQRSLASLPTRQAQKMSDEIGRPVRIDVAQGNGKWTIAARVHPRKEG